MCSFNSSGLMSTYHQCVLVPCHLDESKWNDTESKQYLLSRKTRGEIKIWCALMIKYNVLECMKRYGKDIVTYNFQIIALSSKHTNSWDIQLYQEISFSNNSKYYTRISTILCKAFLQTNDLLLCISEYDCFYYINVEIVWQSS